MVRQLKDQVQELKTHASSEVKYMKKETSMKLAIAQKGLTAKSKVCFCALLGVNMLFTYIHTYIHTYIYISVYIYIYIYIR